MHILVLQCVAFFLNDEEIGHPHIPPLRLALLSCDEPFLSCEATLFHCGKLVSWNGATYTMAFCKCVSWAAGCQDHILFSLLRTYWGEEVTGLRWNFEIFGSIRIHPRMEGRTSRSVIYILKVYSTCSLSCNFWQQDIPSTGFEITFEEYLSSSNVEKKNEVYAFPTSVSLMCFFFAFCCH